MTTEPTPATNSNITETPAAPVGPTITPVEAPPTNVAPPSPEQAPSWVWKADYLLFALVLLLTFFLASFIATNSDLWLNLAIGQRLSEGTLEFGVDPFSWASEGQAWVNHSWLYSWLTFQLFQIVGGEGLVWIKAILMVVTVGLLSRIGWRASSRWFTLICLAMAALAMSDRLRLQPIIASLLCLALTLYVLHRAGVFALRKDDEHPTCPRWLWALPPLFALWANLDDWFILGPMIVGLCWLASGMARFFSAADFGCERAGLVPGTKLGLFFGLGLAACLVNPFHVYVFQLPPELAYMVLSVTDSVGLPMPDAIVAGGRTLKEVRVTDPDLATWTISSLAPAYWREPQRGLNVAGLALYPLLLLGLLAFTLVSLIRPNPNAPTLQLSRFFLWLCFGVMGLALYRMIPFFVVVAAPLTALTLGEFLQWQQVSASVEIARRDRGLNLARFVTIPFMLLLLYLAWPGWLHGTTDFNSPRRVAWGIRADASQAQTALTLKTLKDQGECRNVFNTSLELGNYLPWFAPGVKYGMDTRFSLFPQSAIAYAKARQALATPDKDEAEWQTLFQTHQIDQLAVANYLRSGVVLKFWLNGDHWRQRYLDQRNVLVSWRGPESRWPSGQLAKDLNRRAFGNVPVEQRTPKDGTSQLQTLSFWTLYADGVGPQPVGVGQSKMMYAQYQFHNSFFNDPLQKGGPVSTISFLSIPMAEAMPGGVTFPSALVLVTGWTMHPPRDFGPPALPILMVRAARQAVAENRFDMQAQLTLLEANENLRLNQEDRWINHDPRRGPHPAKLRNRIRQMQLGASLYNIVQLAPDQFEANERLANFYLQQNLLDLALEHKHLAEKALDAMRTDPKYNAKKVEVSLKEYHEAVKTLDNAVKVRLAKWNDIKGKMPPLGQANYAFRGTFQDLVNDRPVEMPLGLGKTALELLANLNPEKLSPDEQIARLVLTYELLLAMGQGGIVADELKKENVRKALPMEIVAQFQLLSNGTIGDYEGMDQAAKLLESTFAESAQRARLRSVRSVTSMFARPTMQQPFGAEFSLTLATSIQSANEMLLQYNEWCNLTALRGILALEVGETKKAREFFQAAIDQAGAEHGFTERPIAQRYLDLLKEQKR